MPLYHKYAAMRICLDFICSFLAIRISRKDLVSYFGYVGIRVLDELAALSRRGKLSFILDQ